MSIPRDSGAPSIADLVTQTIVAGDGSGRLGNCLQAAVASLLRLPLDAVPHFAEADDWLSALTEFAGSHGYVLVDRPTAFGLVLGYSPRELPHAVMVRDGFEWDPHPDRTGLAKVTGYLEFVKSASDGDPR